MTNTDIVRSIEQRLTEAKAELARLEGARQALINGEAPAVTPRPRRAAGKSTPRTTVRASGGVVPAGKLTALLDGSVGMSTSELAKATNGGASQILALLRELESTDQVRRSGERRGTRWHVITDEDRIAARAAEIAAQSKRRSKKAASLQPRRLAPCRPGGGRPTGSGQPSGRRRFSCCR
jgi:hypothetical protein